MVTLEGQYEMPWQLVGSLGYQGSTGRRLIRLVDQTLLVPINTGNFFAVFFPQPDVNSKYHGLNARLARRFTNSFQFEANYRFSTSKDNMSYEGPGAETNQTNPGDIESEYGFSDFDVRHFLTFAGTYATNFFRGGNSAMRSILDGFQTAIVTRNTGFPYTPKSSRICVNPADDCLVQFVHRPTTVAHSTTLRMSFHPPGGNFPGGGAITLRSPEGATRIDRNSFRGPGYFSVDMSVAKKIALPFISEATNPRAAPQMRQRFQ